MVHGCTGSFGLPYFHYLALKGQQREMIFGAIPFYLVRRFRISIFFGLGQIFAEIDANTVCVFRAH
jgi:hypothetical protein